MAQPTKQSPPIRRRDVWDFRPWKPGELPARSSGSVAKDIFPHLPSKGEAASTPTRRELPTRSDKRWGS
jgi:hypothetical protein